MARFSTLRRLISRGRRAIQKARGRTVPPPGPTLPPGMKQGKGCHIYSRDLDRGFGRYITLGDEVVIAPGVRILCHDAAGGQRTGVYLTAPVKIGSRTYIGVECLVLPGVTIGEDVVVGAGSVVTKDVPDGQIVAGNPARQVGTSADLDRRRRALLDCLPAFDPSLYKSPPEQSSRRDELDRAIEDEGGYILLDRAEFERGRVRFGEPDD